MAMKVISIAWALGIMVAAMAMFLQEYDRKDLPSACFFFFMASVWAAGISWVWYFARWP
jgi:hypothetical protein